MNIQWKTFGAGLLCGLLLAGAGFYVFGQRYRVVSSGPSGVMMIRLDSWTGKSWMGRYYDKDGSRIWYWERMEERTQ
jgi:hypothetical protein